MLKKVLIALAALVVLIIVAGIAGLMYVDGRFGIRQAPALSYMEYGGAQADIAVRVDPDQARQQLLGLITQQFGDGPDGIVTNLIAESLPHEVVLMASPRYSDGTIDLTLYVNERRGGPIIARMLTEQLIQQAGAQPIAWDPEGARLERRGVVVLTGETELHNRTISEIDRRWGDNLPLAPQVMDGGNFFELIAANRKGSLYALVSALAIADPDNADFAIMLMLEEVKQLEAMRATANFISNDAMAISILLQCDRAIEDDRPESMRLMLEQIVVPQLAVGLEEAYGLELEGGFVRNGYDLEGDFTLNGIEPYLARTMTAK